MSEPLPYGNACEAWLRVEENGLGIKCMVVCEDESTITDDDVQTGAVSLRGAERSVTGQMINQGYRPAGRWQDARDLDRAEPRPERGIEVMRRFKAATGLASPFALHWRISLALTRRQDK
jgi:hypothetical protein